MCFCLGRHSRESLRPTAFRSFLASVVVLGKGSSIGGRQRARSKVLTSAKIFIFVEITSQELRGAKIFILSFFYVTLLVLLTQHTVKELRSRITKNFRIGIRENRITISKESE